MPAVRIIPCLDVADGRVVKGVQFKDHRDIGDIVDHALRYRDEGADELVFYDITASADRRSIDLAWVRRVSAMIDIPFSVAGGISDVETAARCLSAGCRQDQRQFPGARPSRADRELATAFGRQCVVIGIDSLRSASGDWRVKQLTGRAETTEDAGRETIAWAIEPPRSAPARSCSTAWTATACAAATTSTSFGAGREGRCPGHRVGRSRHTCPFRRSLRGRSKRRACRQRLPRP
jgi:cyclase